MFGFFENKVKVKWIKVNEDTFINFDNVKSIKKKYLHTIIYHTDNTQCKFTYDSEVEQENDFARLSSLL